MVEGIGDPVQELDRVVDQLVSPGDDVAYTSPFHLAIGEFDGGGDHGQYEALHAVAVAGDVGPLGGQQCRIGRGPIGPRLHQVPEPPLHLVEPGLVLPERVVGIEAQHREVVTHGVGVGHGTRA